MGTILLLGGGEAMEKIKIFKIIKILTAIFSGAMIIGFIIQLSRIFFGNLNPMFSRELVGKYIFQILPVIILWIICVVLGIVFHFLTNEKQKQLVKSTNEAKFKLLDSMLPDDILDLDEYQLLLKQKKKRLIALIISSIIYVICFIMISLYLFNPAHFIYNGDINGQVIDMLINMCPWLVISLITLICYTFYVEFNCKTSIEICKKIMSLKGKSNIVKFKKYQHEKLVINILRVSFIAIALVMIILGVINNEPRIVFQKAINICTECIGLG